MSASPNRTTNHAQKRDRPENFSIREITDILTKRTLKVAMYALAALRSSLDARVQISPRLT